MKLNEFFLEQLAVEGAASRKAVERVPDGLTEWKPHQKSMPMGYLATLVATMPSWIEMMIRQDQLDVAPKSPGGYKPPDLKTSRDLVEALDKALVGARSALSSPSTTEEFLMTPWKLLAGGHVVMEQPRYAAIRDVFTHLAHHRGQLTVYLRLNDAKVPSIYGPSADEKTFG